MKKIDTNEVKKTVVEQQNTVAERYVSPDGLIFYSKKDYKEYMDGL